jgi:uncharacterized protein YndB with AHSA1/START domain
MLPNDESDTVCVVRRVLAAPLGVVYRVWTDPAMVARWSWGRQFETIAIEVDWRAGGTYRQHIRDKQTGENWFFDGVIHEVVPGAKLVHTFHWRSDRGTDHGPSLVTIEFVDRGPNTEVVITHTRLSGAEVKKGTEAGWADVCDSVADCLAAAGSNSGVGAMAAHQESLPQTESSASA